MGIDMDTENPNPPTGNTPTGPQDPHPSQRRRFPRWTSQEKDLWIDLLESYSCTLLDPDTSEAQAAERVKIAATLADVAIQEMQYRFWLQKPPARKTATRRKVAPRARRGR